MVPGPDAAGPRRARPDAAGWRGGDPVGAARDDPTRTVQAVVRGRVQGVGFRASCAARADALGIVGWVRNQADGSVQVVASGTSAAVGTLVAWCHQGPALARVTGVDVTEVTDGRALGVEPEGGFAVR